MFDRRQFLEVIGGAAAASALGAAAAKKPNFLLILADDMGFSDAGCYGGEIDTPNLDRLAARGVRFTQGYSTARCGPSRSSLLTGYYAQQTASDVMTPGNVPDYTQFIPDYLKPLGYRSYHSGKWHIRFTPLEGVRFDHSYTLLDEDRYFTPRGLQLDGEPLPQPKPEDHYYSTVAIAAQAVQFLKDHARNHAAAPFFLYLAPHSPHFPLQALPEDIEKYKDRFAEGWDTARERKLARMRRMGLVNCALPPLEPNMWTRWNTPDSELFAAIGRGEVTRAVPWSTLTPEQKRFQRTKMAIHAAMITRMDLEIGKVLDQVRAMGAERDTLVVFLSDNGASSEQLIRGDGHDATAPPGSARTFLGLGPGWSTCSNTPLRLHKSWVNEGGIATPMIVHWPNGIKDQNTLRHDPCHFVDILPTLVDLAGGAPAKSLPPGAPLLAGRSLAPALLRDGAAPHEFLYFNHNNNRAIRVGDWKLIATGETGPWELYDLGKDRSELEDVAAAHPDLAQKLAALWQERDAAYARVRQAAPATNRQRMRPAGAK
ncbi:MAG TPA: arylsulfatase [Bryobacteraceae bacterium]|nr:arylsulfatase [Bryobacteraceae bacterium]